MSRNTEPNVKLVSLEARARARRRSELGGQALTWLCGAALAASLLMVLAVLGILAYHGLAYFWQRDLVLVELDDDTRLLGEIWDREAVPPDLLEDGHGTDGPLYRIRLKTGNRDVTGADFVWMDESRIRAVSLPRDAVLLERTEWGNFYGFLKEIRAGDRVVSGDAASVLQALQALVEQKADERRRIRKLERGEIGDVNYAIERLRLRLRELELEHLPEDEAQRRRAEIEARIAEQQRAYEILSARLQSLREAYLRETLVAATADGREKEMPVGHVLRAVAPNAMGVTGKAGLYAARVWEFVSDEPRESNTEGGIFPAIFGTVLMVFFMAFAATPLGVLAAVYLREYARQGPMVRAVRIAVNNLAGVPSIVFGVFGLGFFVYLVGGTLDRIFFPEALPTPTFGTGGILWASLTLALLTVPVVIVATEEGLAAVPRIVREGSLALGATKFETTFKVVLPAAAPGLLTGMILAMARAAGEVAPLMIVGMVKLAPELPVDHHFPFIHLERKFMHLGFHIYDVGFQSPNVEATKPLVYATAFLLILVVTVMNLLAIVLRNHLRKKYASSAV